MNAALEHAWPQVRAHLRRAVPAATFAIWLEELRPVALTAETLVLAAADDARRRWVADRFGRVLQTCSAAVLGPEVTVDIVVDEACCAGDEQQQTRPAPRRARTPRRPGDDRVARTPPAEQAFQPKLTFDQFVIGEANRLAHAAALAVAEMPGQAYNPLFIYGPPGNGKTHLLHSIGNYLLAHGGDLTVRYATIESFTNAFVAALQDGSIDAFKARFRRVDVLLVDDVQFLESKARTEEEFFHTFNALHESGSQLVLTSDRLPRELRALEDRLRERFEAGLLTDIRAPDRETRLTILRKRARHDGIALADEDALHLIADRIVDNIRLLEGAFIRVVAFASLTGRPIDAGLSAQVLDGLYRHQRPVRRSIDDVQRATCEAFELSPEELLSARRTQRLVWPRQVAMYLARELTDQTLPAIGRAFGGRDHTTVMHACRRTAERIGSDPEAERLVRDLTDRLRGRS